MPKVPQKSAALLLVFHGSNQTGEKMRAFSGNVFDEFVQEHGFVVVYPDGYKGHWNDARLSSNFPTRKAGIDDVAFTKAIIHEIRAKNDIDGKKVYLAGYSNGGQMVIRLIHEWPYPFAGAMIIAATQPVAANFLAVSRETSLPILLMHGTSDPLVPYNGGMASLWGWNPRGLGLSAHETAHYYARRNRIASRPTISTLEQGKKNGLTVTVEEYSETGKYPVKLVSIEGGGHVVPNPYKKAPFLLGKTATHVNSAKLLWNFLQQQQQ
ncbi:MAG: dienelactone hydrolase family protein [Ktedonobacteraceae bacterium]|nr:dienelactone hydrolase family protein [Ktedonobacteraceae bacterium]